jgi:hypothetical protein
MWCAGRLVQPQALLPSSIFFPTERRDGPGKNFCLPGDEIDHEIRLEFAPALL